MAKTSTDVVTAAYRRIGVAATDSPLDADNYEIGFEAYQGMFAEFAREGLGSKLTNIEALPDWAFNAVVEMLAVQLEPNHEAPSSQRTWRSGLRRLRRLAFTDDREDPADVDDDGVVSADEKDAYDRAAFY